MSVLATKLGDICEIKRGTTITQKNAVEGEIPVVAGGIKPTYFHNTANRTGKTITISGSGANAGYVNFWSVPIFASDCSTVQVLREDVCVEYIHYFLLSKQEFIYKELRSGAAQPHVYGKDIANIEVNVPEILIQKKIVAKLDAIFADIDKAMVASEANAKNSDRLYSSAVDIFFENLNDNSVKLSACADIGYGYTSKSSVDFDGPQYLRITDIQYDNVDWLLVPRIQDTEVEVKKFLLKNGDIVFARTGATTGKSFLVAEPPISVFASYLIRVDADRSLVLPEYLRHFFRSEGYWNAINAGISGAAQGGFNASKLGELAFPLPVLDKQRKIVEKLTAIEMLAISSKKSFEMKVKLLESLKNSVLRKAFSNELVKE